MDEFPFSEEEWQRISDAALPVVNAGLAEDYVVRASYLIELLEVLGELRARHGDHPVLLETEADFIQEDEERLALYARALSIAMENELPTLSIRLSYASVLIDGHETVAAREVLLAGECELDSGDDSDRESWADMIAKCPPP